LFVEGGGDQRRTQVACRKAFSTFLGKLLDGRPKPRIIASGSRDNAYREFLWSLTKDPGAVALLLVDSEDPVPAGKSAAAHLRDREPWSELPDGRVHLMVQCMEAWFLADKEMLAQYYGHGFKDSALPRNPKIEEIPKGDILRGLKESTAKTRKQTYHKTRHAFDLLERLDPNAVRKSSPFADAFFKVLGRASR
jgi:hypothetical protein